MFFEGSAFPPDGIGLASCPLCPLCSPLGPLKAVGGLRERGWHSLMMRSVHLAGVQHLSSDGCWLCEQLLFCPFLSGLRNTDPSGPVEGGWARPPQTVFQGKVQIKEPVLKRMIYSCLSHVYLEDTETTLRIPGAG